jgi:hypothetical protein
MPRKTNTQNIDIIMTRLDYIREDVSDIKHRLEGQYVTKDEFAPVAKIVYGMVSVILLAVIGALVALVVRQ